MLIFWFCAGLLGLYLEIAASRYIEKNEPIGMKIDKKTVILSIVLGFITLGISVMFCGYAVVVALKKKYKKKENRDGYR